VLEPSTVTVKSNPVPWSGTDAPVGSVVVVTARKPVCAPAAVGANTTPVVQLNPGPSVAAQVLLASWKLAGTPNATLVRAVRLPVLVTVTVVGLLVWPTPIVGKLTVAGVTWMAAATDPVPLNPTVAELAIVADEMLNVPIAGPVAEGAKTTPTVQFEFAARFTGQAFWVRLNTGAGATESVSCPA
jgi:hypothetical protein